MEVFSDVHVLRLARALIERPERWIQKVAATDADGVAVSSSCEDATRWCAWGAIVRTGGFGRAVAALACAMGYGGGLNPSRAIFDFNDSHTHAEVIGAFDQAIAILEGVP